MCVRERCVKEVQAVAAWLWLGSGCGCLALRLAPVTWPTPITPMGVPLLSTRVVALSKTSTFLPSREYNGNSKLSVPW